MPKLADVMGTATTCRCQKRRLLADVARLSLQNAAANRSNTELFHHRLQYDSLRSLWLNVLCTELWQVDEFVLNICSPDASHVPTSCYDLSQLLFTLRLRASLGPPMFRLHLVVPDRHSAVRKPTPVACDSGDKAGHSGGRAAAHRRFELLTIQTCANRTQSLPW